MPRLPQPQSVADFFYGTVTVGERGQVVIPAQARKQQGLEPGEKLLVFRHPHARGVMLARLEDVQAILAELKQLHELILEGQEARPTVGRQKGRRRAPAQQ